MVTHLQHGAFQFIARSQNILFLFALGIARKQERCFAIYDTQNKGHVVGVFALPHRPKHLHLRAAQREYISRLGNGNFFPLFCQIDHKVIKGLAVKTADTAQRLIHRSIIQRTGQTAHVVLMSMGSYDIIQMRDRVLLQIGVDQAAVRPVASVNEHGPAITQDKGCVRLSHINEMDLKRRFLHLLTKHYIPQQLVRPLHFCRQRTMRNYSHIATRKACLRVIFPLGNTHLFGKRPCVVPAEIGSSIITQRF